MKTISGAPADSAELRVFVAVARTGTVVRAAETLGRTQPSVSARLAGLERRWGTRLFRREARGMRLTPEGERLLPLAEAALRAVEEVDRAAGLPLGAHGIRVGAGDALGRRLLPRAMAALLAQDPAIEVRILEGPGERLTRALRRGEIDVALVVDPGEGRDEEALERRPLTETAVVLLEPRAAPGPLRRRLPLERLARSRLVALQPGSSFRRHLETAFAARGLPFRPAVEVGNLSLVRRFVAAGLGVAPVPAVAFETPGPRIAGVPVVRYAALTRRGVPLADPATRLLHLLAEDPQHGPTPFSRFSV